MRKIGAQPRNKQEEVVAIHYRTVAELLGNVGE